MNLIKCLNRNLDHEFSSINISTLSDAFLHSTDNFPYLHTWFLYQKCFISLHVTKSVIIGPDGAVGVILTVTIAQRCIFNPSKILNYLTICSNEIDRTCLRQNNSNSIYQNVSIILRFNLWFKFIAEGYWWIPSMFGVSIFLTSWNIFSHHFFILIVKSVTNKSQSYSNIHIPNCGHYRV